MKYTQLSDFYKKHNGETIYLIGNGPGALDIPEQYKNKIQKGISISVNSSQLWGPTTYQASSTWSCYLHTCHYGVVTECRFYQGQGIGTDSSWPHGGATTLPPSFFSDNNTLQISSHMHNPQSVDALFTKPENNSPFFGRDNIIFTATHLATLMGAGEIVYLGFDMRDNGHYYDTPVLMDMHIQQTNELKEMYSSDPHILADIERMEENNIKRVPSEYAEANYAKNNWPMPRLIEMFNCMRENGTVPVCHKEDSIIFDSGATLRKLK